jgi:hypothetical protein
MKRDYSNGVDDTKELMFVGHEIENTRASGMFTLFVSGVINLSKILAQAKKQRVNHIFLGANHSLTLDTSYEIMTQAKELISNGFFVSIDYDSSLLHEIWKYQISSHDSLCHIVRLHIPNAKDVAKNTCIKIDDSVFKGTNPGVWVTPLLTVLVDQNLTTWDRYSKDEIL